MYDIMIQDHNTDRQRNFTLDAATTRIESYSSTTFRYVKLEILTVGSGAFRVGALGELLVATCEASSLTGSCKQSIPSPALSHTSPVTSLAKVPDGKLNSVDCQPTSRP
jgi:hypothetical protein